MNLPTAADINIFDSPDERSACEHFLSKTLDQAETLFRENALYYQEDLMWMGPVAFRYYLPAFIRYIQSEHATGDAAAIDCFHGLIKFRLEHDRLDIAPAAIEISSACHYILNFYEKFDVAAHYGNLRQAFQSLLAEIENR